MSFERFSTSDVYVFEHVGGFIECCGCSITMPWDGEVFGFARLATPREALEHLDQHELNGDDIGNARDRIIKEHPDLDIEIEPWSPPNPEFDMYMQEYERIKYLANQHPPQQFRDRSNGE